MLRSAWVESVSHFQHGCCRARTSPAAQSGPHAHPHRATCEGSAYEGAHEGAYGRWVNGPRPHSGYCQPLVAAASAGGTRLPPQQHARCCKMPPYDAMLSPSYGADRRPLLRPGKRACFGAAEPVLPPCRNYSGTVLELSQNCPGSLASPQDDRSIDATGTSRWDEERVASFTEQTGVPVPKGKVQSAVGRGLVEDVSSARGVLGAQWHWSAFSAHMHLPFQTAWPPMPKVAALLLTCLRHRTFPQLA